MRRRILPCLALLLAAGCASAGCASARGGSSRGGSTDIVVTRVVGREHPGPYKHPASITELANGDLYIAYYGGSGEYGTDTAVFGMRRRKGATSWSKPVVIADTPDVSEGNPVVWQAPDGIVWLFYVNRYGETWATSRIKGKISRDGARTWSDSFLLTFEEGTMVRGQPLVVAGGDYLLPVYLEVTDNIEWTLPGTCSFFLRRDAKTGTWSESSRIRSPTGNLQAQVAPLSDDHLVCYIRRGGDFEPTTEGWLLRAESRDGGRTWTNAERTEFRNPNSAVDFIRLHNGHFLLVYNDSMNDRTPLTVAISTDGDRTYPHRRDILTGDNSFAYPYAIQARDGRIHIICTTDERSTILHIELDEDAILSSTP